MEVKVACLSSTVYKDYMTYNDARYIYVSRLNKGEQTII